MPIKRKRRKSPKRLASLRAARRKDAKKAATIAKREALQHAAAKPVVDGCQHPRTRARGCCVRPAIVDANRRPILFTIPDAYVPATRHALQPALPRPLSRLCVQHKFLLDAYLERDEGRPKDFPHRSQCPVCRHPKCDDYVQQWVTHERSASSCARLMDVSFTSFMKHVVYYGWDEKRTDKRNINLALSRIVDDGLDAGGATTKEALRALELQMKQRGDPINVDMRMVVKDLSNLSDKELAAEMKAAALALELSSKEQGA